MLHTLKASLSVSLSRDEVLGATAAERDQFQEDFLNGTTVSEMPPHRLELRPGALVMCLRNIAPDQGVCNGTRAVVLRLHKFLVEMALVTPPYTGRVIFLPRVCCNSSAGGELPFTLRQRRFPLKLSWVMTINKTQGQSIKNAWEFTCPGQSLHMGKPMWPIHVVRVTKNVRAVVEQEEGLQGVFQDVQGIPSGAYTLNIVDRSLLTSFDGAASQAAGPQPLSMMVDRETMASGSGQELGDELVVGAASSCQGHTAPQLPLLEYVEQAPTETAFLDSAGSDENGPTRTAWSRWPYQWLFKCSTRGKLLQVRPLRPCSRPVYIIQACTVRSCRCHVKGCSTTHGASGHRPCLGKDRQREIKWRRQ